MLEIRYNSILGHIEVAQISYDKIQFGLNLSHLG